jgi:hypothetical protein
MMRRKAPARIAREVRIMFEPTRLADDYLADAYMRLVPVVQRHLDAASLWGGNVEMQARAERREVQP